MPDAPKIIPDPAVTDRLRSELPGWALTAGWIQRTFHTGGWPKTLLLVNAVAFLSEAADHHPDLVVGYREVRVRLRTHESDGVTERDLALAREIDRLVLWRPPQGSPLTGPRGAWISGAPS